MWHHPNYYKELAKQRKKLEEELKRQASSNKQKGTSDDKEKQQAIEESVPYTDIIEASSDTDKDAS